MARWPKKKPVPAGGEGTPPAARGEGADVVDIAGVLFAVMFLVGLFVWFGLGPALTIVGGLGLLGVLILAWATSLPPKKQTGG
jgi:hypothetical protein